ncbi:MAG TPA: 4-(cytidine 5'-diphospho)-2-C-methyl-D-erythritol kinase [Gammaproteobacteria bacterium]|nr:4-(cytidine 5'-diphospho)-2-C-methyl-D-erythritol kinase [Gammaproteobacteria bacterium]
MNDPRSMPWPAPAKLNLFLHVTGRRADGYHELQTLFQFVDFGDELYFRVDDSGLVRRREALTGVAEDTDLAVRAARLLQAETGCGQGVEIHIDKRLPMGGGLGGGSSDAATTLVALNRLWGLGLPEDRLAGLGLRLGADVPVFVRGRAAWAEGLGEQLVPVELPEPWFVILQPDAHVATADLFADPRLTRDLQPIKIRDYLAGVGRNVFEPLVRAAYPDVDAALRWLNARAAGRMTGTGACVFAAFGDEGRARQVASEAAGRWPAIVARGRNRSPLHVMIEA